MKYDIKEVSARLKATRESLDYTVGDMARAARITEQEYLDYEEGRKDLSLSVLNSCAEAMGIEMIELLTGSSPTLATYSLVRKGEGLPIERRIGFTYQHMAYLFKNKKIEPIMVHAPYEPDQSKPIAMSVHEVSQCRTCFLERLDFVWSRRVRK